MTGGLTGGAAHAAVASSALFGTLSGAAISNVVSTGVMTIPVIKKSGFRASFAVGVEAAASTGELIMPPVMGVVAFFVAGQIGLDEGEDYDAIKANWQTGLQAFQDGKIDVYTIGCLDPCGQFTPVRPVTTKRSV